MKKRILAVLLAGAMVLSLAACGIVSPESTLPGAEEPAVEEPAAEEPEAEAPEAEEPATEEATEEEPAAEAPVDMHFEIVSKGFQHQYWQSVLKGAQDKAAELGVTIEFVGPNTESDIADQVQMFNNAINKQPAAIGLAALDTQALLDAIQASKDAGIPIIGFDSGVPDAPEGAVLANCSTDNYAAGELAAEHAYPAIKDRVAAGGVRIGVVGQDATAESIIQRGLGFIDKVAALIEADGKTVAIEGNDKYVGDSKVEAGSAADVIIEVRVPAQVSSELLATEAATLLNKDDIIAVFGSNAPAAEGLVTANENINKLGDAEDQVIGIGFDSGTAVNTAVADGVLFGAVTQAPVAMGEWLVDLLYKAANGEAVSDIDTGAQWYDASNIENPEISQNLYD